jgi:hypothetical protein
MRWQAVLVDPLDLDISGPLARELSAGDFGRIVESFGQDVLRLTEEMAAGLAAGDRMAVHCAAHGLAGAAASVGAVMLEQVARLGLGKGACPPDLIPRVRVAGVEATQALRALMPRSDAA